MIPKITNEGYYRQLMASKGEGINFTKITLGNGEKPSEYRTLTDLMNPLVDVLLDNIEIHRNEDTDDGYALLTGTFNNSGLEAGFEWSEVGIFCSNPASTEEEPLDDILYAYGHYLLDDDAKGAANIPKKGTEIFEVKLSYRIYVGNLDGITASLNDSLTFATKLELNEHLEAVNPHGITAKDVGLEKVPNRTTNEQTPTYTEAINDPSLVSGETLSTAFGKIALAIKLLIAHLFNHVIHISTAERDKWNNKSDEGHKHSATDITSGTLQAARGGTGYTSLASLWTGLWSTRNAYLDNNRGLYGKNTSGNIINLIRLNSLNGLDIGSDSIEGAVHIHGGNGMMCFSVTDGTTRKYIRVSTDGTLYGISKYNLGSSNYRWGTVYCSSSVNTSDLKTKENITDIKKAHELIMGLEAIQFDRDGDKRLAFGFGAQTLYELCQELGIKNSALYDAGKVISDDDEGVSNLTDNEINATDDSELNWGLDYTQLIAPMVKMLQEHENRIAELEAQLGSKEVK